MSHSQITLTKKGYSANPAWQPLTDPGDNADENAAGSPDVKRDPSRSSCYDFRSPTDIPCGKEHIVVYQGNKSYTRHVCPTHSLLCPGFRCEASKYCLITDLNKSVVCGCRCSKQSGSGRKLKLKREDAF